jgi:hypothetical protein
MSQQASGPTWHRYICAWIGTFVGAIIWQFYFGGGIPGLLISAAIAMVVGMVLSYIFVPSMSPGQNVAGSSTEAQPYVAQPIGQAAPAPDFAQPVGNELACLAPSQPVVAGTSRSADVEKIVNDYRSRIRGGEIYFAPNIPPKKLRNALASYAQGANCEKPLVLIDNTIFHSAKDGALLTDRAIYSHNQFESPQVVSLDAICGIAWEEGTCASKLSLNGTKFLDSNIPDKNGMQLFCMMLAEIASLYHPECFQEAAPEKSALDVIRELNQLVAEGILSPEEFEAKKKELLARV